MSLHCPPCKTLPLKSIGDESNWLSKMARFGLLVLKLMTQVLPPNEDSEPIDPTSDIEIEPAKSSGTQAANGVRVSFPTYHVHPPKVISVDVPPESTCIFRPEDLVEPPQLEISSQALKYLSGF